MYVFNYKSNHSIINSDLHKGKLKIQSLLKLLLGRRISFKLKHLGTFMLSKYNDDDKMHGKKPFKFFFGGRGS